MFFPQVFSVFVLVPTAVVGHVAATCDSCTTQFNADYTTPGVADINRCSAAKAYAVCLVGASGAGCTSVMSKASTALQSVTTINSISGVSCALSGTCLCETTHLTFSPVSTCTASATTLGCMYGSTDVSCDGTTSNTAKRAVWRAKVKEHCSVCAGSFLKCTLSTLIFVVLGVALKD
ncbi:uncharacterized protein LOC124289678 [Haliotis rubra]|uniref:uncharacterized protein LOC124289678 n=1 Tax=Haliotis rubra TaxID=36100 RepID=UPI001EE5CAF1|nr:uncharacterized protein LOC124289678 [Haliotis rubra]